MRNIKKLFKKYSAQLIVVVLTLLIAELIFVITLKSFPFQKANLLISDLYHEYVPFFNYMRDAILSGRSILGSFSFSLGQSTIGILAYYCLSPLNLLLLLSNFDSIVYFIKVIMIIKIILCSLNMSIYLKDKVSKGNNIMLSLIYAFISFTIKYAFNIMWLDVVYMLPLVILGLENLIDKSSNKLYIVSLAIMIFSNFYMAFGACVFTLIYFLFYASIKNKLNKNTIWKFIYSSLLAGLLNAFLLLPTIYNMIGGKAINADSHYKNLILYNPISVIYNFTFGSTAGSFLNDLPYFYSSLLLLVLFINYFFTKENSYKEKVLVTCIFFFIIFVTLIGPLDLIFHCFRVPNQLYYRYIYILPFFMISVVARNKVKISYLSLIPIFIIISWALLVEFSFKMAIFGIFLLVYFLLSKFNFKKTIFLILIFELVSNGVINFKIYNGHDNYNDVKKSAEVLHDYLPKENEFYRVELINPLTFNDNFLLGTYGINSFSPTISNSSKKFLKEYLLLAEDNSLNYVYINRFLLDPYILGIKYEVVENEIHENKYYLPLIIKASNLDYFEPTPFIIENSNNIYKMINGEYLFKEVDFEIDCLNEHKYIISSECHLKYSKKDGYSYYIEAMAENGLSNVFKKDNIEKNFIFEAKDVFEVSENYKIDAIKLYEYDEKSIKNQKNDFEVFNDTYMRLKVEKGIYMTTIPYDESWHIRVNGKEIKKIKVLDSLIGFETDGGTLEIEFIPKGLIAGSVITIITLIAVFSYCYRKKFLGVKNNI